MLSFQSYSLWVLIGSFAGASGFVWAAGTRLSGYLDRIAQRTGIGGGLLGLFLLGGITSLPEFATVSTASWVGNAPLAVNNVLGSAAINVLLLALADAFIGRRALTSVVGEPTPLLQGVLGIILLTVVVIAILAGDVSVLGVGIWSTALVPLFCFSVWLTSKYEQRPPWTVTPDGTDGAETRGGSGESATHARAQELPGGSLHADIVKTCLAALVILAAGFVLAKSGDAIAQQTGLGSGLLGLVLLGFATSLPEISSIYAAVKLERYSMVLGDVFGTNIFNVLLIFLADAIYDGNPVLSEVGVFEAVATLIAILLTSIYLVGLLERRDRTILLMGYASFAVIVTYASGLIVLLYMSGR